jgi:signal transduction histidine kinase/DNA-binding response OmpR family regulator
MPDCKVNILVVDDLPDKRLAFREVLEELDENLVLVESGTEALRELLVREFAVIILDVNMPDIDGIETAELIRAHGKTAHTPIIFVTAYADELQTTRGYALGAVDYIRTPLIPEILRSKVRVFVDLFRAQRRAAEAARAEAERAAAEAAKRSSEFLAYASRELGASLHLDSILTRLLELLVPAVGGCAALELDIDGQSEARYKKGTAPVEALESLASLPPAVCRAVAEARAGGYLMGIRVESTDAASWPDGLRFAYVLPLVAGERRLGACVVGTRASTDIQPLDEHDLREVATRAAIAVDNARLYRSLEREMARAKAAEEKLQDASRRKDEFLAMLSHELRNPLSPIISAVHVLGKIAPEDGRIAWAREVVERQVTHLAGLVDDLLDVSRITQGKITLNREAVNLAKVLEHSIEIVRSPLDAKQHRLHLRIPETPVWVFGDFARLCQIFSNALHNAIKYTADNGEIDLTAAPDRGSVVVVIRDNGIGIEPQFLPHVFDVFTQGYRGLDRSQGGLGVGLAVVRRLVELHQGEVSVSSAGAGRGTEVRVTLPCISEVPQPAVEAAALSPLLGDARRVLVVDDNSDAAESIAMYLSLSGHEVRTVGDGHGALACLDAFTPHAAIVDIGLPVMNGYELARAIRTRLGAAAPLMIALTGYGQAEDFDLSRAAGFDHHFVKPADLRSIQSLIEGPSAALVRERRSSS